MISGNSGITMQTSERVNLGITLQRSVLEQLDAARGDIPRSRAIERAVQAKLGIKPPEILTVPRGGGP